MLWYWAGGWYRRVESKSDCTNRIRLLRGCNMIIAAVWGGILLFADIVLIQDNGHLNISYLAGAAIGAVAITLLAIAGNELASLRRITKENWYNLGDIYAAAAGLFPLVIFGVFLLPLFCLQNRIPGGAMFAAALSMTSLFNAVMTYRILRGCMAFLGKSKKTSRPGAN